ncbi:type VI secretion system baseplate subunit TssF [Danxiaibacter flavus]|uniref:Type VI secretion system baseplate subunit TssF n=1 Tax=Danxiaibacter flavus TaxID=3049108 RepID=A0ABV3ZCS1_9BACT|nr:type VI secretion system baseplate subunit TssF [Chitinophagaceae bacterium DXS]
MQLKNQFTKEAIKSRLMENASSLWDVKNVNALDPFVKLLMEAFSTEVYRAANEVQNIEGRILDKISQLLTPTFLTMPQSAHAVMRASPADESYLLSPFTPFTAKKKATAHQNKDALSVHFTPVDYTFLVKAKINCMAAGHQVFAFDSAGFRQTLARTSMPLPWATCYIGIEASGELNNLKDASLYFDFPSHITQNWIYQLLPLCKAAIGNEPVEVCAGQKYGHENNVSTEEQIFEAHDMMLKITDKVKLLYQHKFLTMNDCPIPTAIKISDLPDDIKSAFNIQILNERLSKKFIWLKLSFPASFTYEIMEDMHIHLNAFPVVNRSFVSHTHNLQSLYSIIPLTTNTSESFMTVHRVSDSNNRTLTEIPYGRSSTKKTGYYSLRYGGAERFDNRSAQDIVNYLIELCRDEVVAFSSLDQDFMITILQTLSRELNIIEHKAANTEKQIKKTTTYLITEAFDINSLLFAEYWVTQSTLANNIRSGTFLKAMQTSALIPEECVLLSETTGGKESLKSGERLNAYRYSLGSRDRLVTQEDIRNFCRYEMGDKFKDIKFSKGLMISPHPKQGYIRTLDITLTPYRFNELNNSEWNLIANDLLHKIKGSSCGEINYRIFVEQTLE